MSDTSNFTRNSNYRNELKSLQNSLSFDNEVLLIKNIENGKNIKEIANIHGKDINTIEKYIIYMYVHLYYNNNISPPLSYNCDEKLTNQFKQYKKYLMECIMKLNIDKNTIERLKEEYGKELNIN